MSPPGSRRRAATNANLRYSSLSAFSFGDLYIGLYDAQYNIVSCYPGAPCQLESTGRSISDQVRTRSPGQLF